MKKIDKNMVVYTMLLLSLCFLVFGTFYADPYVLMAGLCSVILSTIAAWYLGLI